MLHLEIVARKSERTALIVHALRLKLSDHIEKRFLIAHHCVALIIAVDLDRKYQNRTLNYFIYKLFEFIAKDDGVSPFYNLLDADLILDQWEFYSWKRQNHLTNCWCWADSQNVDAQLVYYKITPVIINTLLLGELPGISEDSAAADNERQGNKLF